MAARKKTAAPLEPERKGRTKEFPRTIAFRVTELEYEGLRLIAEETGTKVGYLVRNYLDGLLTNANVSANEVRRKAEAKAKREANKNAKRDAELTKALTTVTGRIMYCGFIHPEGTTIRNGFIVDPSGRVKDLVNLEEHARVRDQNTGAAVKAFGGRLD